MKVVLESQSTTISSSPRTLQPFNRHSQDRMAKKLFLLVTALPMFVIVSMVISLFFRAQPILATGTVWDFLTGQTWHPLQGSFGLFPFIVGTLWVTLVSMVFAVPPCILTAIYLSEYARPALRTLLKPILDLLAGIPSVVYGVWGIVAIVPWVQGSAAPILGKWLGFIPLFAVDNPTGYSILAGGIVLAVMVAPVIISVTYEVLRSVPDGLRHASLAVGATKWQTIKYAGIPTAAPGILAGVVLGFSRAFGETMAVMMVVGNVPILPSSIFDPAYPLTALIANNYGEMLSIPLYDAALMGAALVLLLVVLVFNVFSAIYLHTVIGRSKL